MYILHFVFPFICWWTLELFPPLWVCCVQNNGCTSIWILVFCSLGYIARCRIAWAYGSSMFKFLRNHQRAVSILCEALWPTFNESPFLKSLEGKGLSWNQGSPSSRPRTGTCPGLLGTGFTRASSQQESKTSSILTAALIACTTKLSPRKREKVHNKRNAFKSSLRHPTHRKTVFQEAITLSPKGWGLLLYICESCLMRSRCSVNSGVNVGRPKSVGDCDTDKPGFLCHPMTAWYETGSATVSMQPQDGYPVGWGLLGLHVSPPSLIPQQATEEEFQFLRCQGCRAEAKCPKLLPCLHTLCSGCLEESGVQCPVCRAPWPSGAGTQALDNVFFESLQRRLSVYQQIAREQAFCTRCKEPANYWCFECEQLICHKCFEAHQWFLKHEARPLAELRSQSIREFLDGTRKSNNIFCSNPNHRTPMLTRWAGLPRVRWCL